MYSINFFHHSLRESTAKMGYRLVISPEFPYRPSIPLHIVQSVVKIIIASLQLLDPGGSTRLHLVQPLDELDQLSPALVLKLVLVTGQHGLENGQQLRGEAADGLVLPLVYRNRQLAILRSAR